jgi:hypothetical protein
VISGTKILVQAKLIAKRLNLDNFQGSHGWLVNFLSRFCFTLRRIGSAGKDLPLNVKPLIEKFHEACRAKRVHFTRSQILNADETNIQLDSPDNYTYDKRGEKKITAATTGQQKTNLSIMICASANGEKLLPVFVLQ